MNLASESSQLVKEPEGLFGFVRGFGAVLIHNDAITQGDDRCSEKCPEPVVFAIAWFIHRDYAMRHEELQDGALRFRRVCRIEHTERQAPFLSEKGEAGNVGQAIPYIAHVPQRDCPRPFRDVLVNQEWVLERLLR